MLDFIVSASVKGVVLASRKKLVNDRFGAEAWEKIVAKLRAEDRELRSRAVLELIGSERSRA